MTSKANPGAVRSSLWRRVWRWHFSAGLFVVPFVLILSLTGSIYLFKPQYEAAVERSINARAPVIEAGAAALPADRLAKIALAAHPGASLRRVVLPHDAADRSFEIELNLADGARVVWIDRLSGEILHDAAAGERLMAVVMRVHGTLLGGDFGSLIVEIAASWTIILIVTGLYLWWPRGQVWWRVFVPDFAAGGAKRETWRKVHGAAGAWIGLLVLAMLLTGLPWTQVWGAGFQRAQDLIGLKSPGQEWFVTLQSVPPGGSLWEIDSGETAAAEPPAPSALSLQTVVDKAQAESFAPPVWVQPPRGETGVWTVRGMSPDRPKRETVHFDRWSGEVVMRIRFSDHNPLDRVMALGVAFHEGVLFGWLNRIAGLLAAIGVAALAVTGTTMWWKRRPKGRLAAPALPEDRKIAAGALVLIVALAVFLPMAGVTLVAALAIDTAWKGLSGLRRSQA